MDEELLQITFGAVTDHEGHSICVKATYRVIQEESARLREMIVCVILSKKVHNEHGSDFERLRSYDRLKLRIEGNDY